MSKSKMPHLISCSRKELSVSTIFPFDSADGFVYVKFHTLYFS